MASNRTCRERAFRQRAEKRLREVFGISEKTRIATMVCGTALALNGNAGGVALLLVAILSDAE